MIPTKILHILGANTKFIWQLFAAANPRVPVAVTISSGGDILKPMVAFKWTPTRKNAGQELPFILSDCALICQENFWMDEKGMLK